MSRNSKPFSRKYKKFQSDKSINEIIEILSKVTSKDPSLSNFENFTKLAADWAQVLMLVIVAFGYFYTVLPVFQKEQLSEELARLNLEKNSWQEQIEDHKKEIFKYENEVISLEKAKKNLSSSLKTLHKDNELADQRFNEASNRAIKAENEILNLEKTKAHLTNSLEGLRKDNELAVRKLNKANNRATKAKNTADKLEISLKEAEQNLYEIYKMQLTGEMLIPAVHLRIIELPNRVVFKKESKLNVAKYLEESFIQPLDLAKETLDEIKRNIDSSNNEPSKKATSRLLKEFEKGLVDQNSLLRCSRPDFHKWQNVFIQALNNSDTLSNKCVENLWNNRIADEKWTLKNVISLKETEFWENENKIHESHCSIITEYEIEKFLELKWHFVNEPCSERLKELNAIVLKSKSSSEIMPLRNVSPPTMVEIYTEVETTILNL